MSYQWQYSQDNGKTWKNSGLSGSKTAKLTVQATDARLSVLYRCKVTCGNEVAVSEGAHFVRPAELKVEVSPMEIEATASENVIFKATVTGASGAVSYQWQYSQDNGKTWKNSGLSGSKTAKLKVQATDARLSVLYRCKVTCGNQVAVSEGAHFVRPDSPFVWSTNADGTLTLVQYRANEATVVVPETYNGKTVTVIGESAFEGKDLTSVDLPDTIIVIGKRAFADCKNLSEMK